MTRTSIFLRKYFQRILPRSGHYDRVENLSPDVALEIYSKIINLCHERRITLISTLRRTNYAVKVKDRQTSEMLYGVFYMRYEKESVVLATLLHEIGHIFLWRAGIETQFLTMARISLNKGHPIYLNEKLAIVAEENGAWAVGEELAKLLGIELGPWFFDVKRIAMESYEKIVPLEIMRGETNT